MSDRQLSELWLTTLLQRRGASLGTIDTYRDDLDVYLGWLTEQGVALLEVRFEHIVRYLRHLAENGYSEASLIKKRSVVRSLHIFLWSEGYVGSNPTALLEPMKRVERQPGVIAMADVDALLVTAHNKAEDTSLSLFARASYSRRAALLETLYASGMRVTEAVTLPRSALGDSSGMLYIKGRAGVERLVPMHDRAVEAIDRWRRCAEAYGVVSEQWVFHSVRDGSKALTRQTALAEIKQAALDAALPHAELISPKTLRHAFAAHLLANGMDLHVIQEMLGHTDLGTTEIYVQIEPSQERSRPESLHPLND